MPYYREEVLYYLLGGTVFGDVEWGQKWPENIFCPNKLAGCVPVSIAQTLAFFEYPEGISITYDNADVTYQPLDWAALKKHTPSTNIRYPEDSDIVSHLKECEANYETHVAIGRLLRQIGEIANVSYEENSTTGTISSSCFSVAQNLLNGKGLKYSYGNDTKQLFSIYSKKKENDRSMAIFYGFDNSASHTWICDGYMQTGKKTEYYDRVTGELVMVKDETTKYLHMNWGWAGECNGFFLLDVLNTSQGYDGMERPLNDNFENMDFSDDFHYMFIEL